MIFVGKRLRLWMKMMIRKLIIFFLVGVVGWVRVLVFVNRGGIRGGL